MSLKSKITDWLFRGDYYLFDFDWYAKNNKLGPFWQKHPFLHFFLSQKKHQSNTHPLFDINYFLKQCELNKLPLPTQPIKCYLQNPDYWPLNTHPLFDAQYYLEQTHGKSNKAPLIHYLNGGHLRFDPHPLFERHWYIDYFPLLKKSQRIPALSHYIKTGAEKNASTHPLFHSAWYSKKHGLENSGAEQTTIPLLHFLVSARERKNISCHPLLDINHVRQQCGDTKHSDLQIIESFLKYERNQSNPHRLFDNQFYHSQLKSFNKKSSLLVHYLKKGYHDYNPHPLFHTEWYLGRNSVLRKRKGPNKIPLTHFLIDGQKKGESPHPLFLLQWYRNSYMAGLVDENKSPLLHFLDNEEQHAYRPNPLFGEDWKEIALRKYHVSKLEDIAGKLVFRFPEKRNRMTDNFSTPYLIDKPALVPNAFAGTKNYIILFTPRSGSSWLTELITQEKRFGQPGEWLNPDLMQGAMRSFKHKVRNIHEFCYELRQTHKSRENIFGAEIASAHLRQLRELTDMNYLFRDAKYIFHYRENIVAQAISLFMATESGFFHASNTTNKDNHVVYDEKTIRRWIKTIRFHEQEFEEFLTEMKIQPYMSSYDKLRNDTAGHLQSLCDHIGETPHSLLYQPSKKATHKKIGKSINIDYEEKFRSENSGFIEEIEASRVFIN